MTVYVDDMRAPYGRMIMCHMVADGEDELHAMAGNIGVSRKWHQGDHYDICLAQRAVAVDLGAMEISQRQLGAMVFNRRCGGGPAGGSLGDPETAEDVMFATLEARRAEAEAVGIPASAARQTIHRRARND